MVSPHEFAQTIFSEFHSSPQEHIFMLPQQKSHTDLGSQQNFLLSVFRDTIHMGAKHAFLNASPHYFGTPTFDAISHASERLKSARFGDTMTAPIPS